jgi:hypothetical protein
VYPIGFSDAGWGLGPVPASQMPVSKHLLHARCAQACGLGGAVPSFAWIAGFTLWKIYGTQGLASGVRELQLRTFPRAAGYERGEVGGG